MTGLRLWVDDLREPRYEMCVWAKTSEQAITFLDNIKTFNETYPNYAWEIELVSLDHDLGGDDTTRPVVIWMIENNFWPKEVYVHSANPVGVTWLEGTIERYKP